MYCYKSIAAAIHERADVFRALSQILLRRPPRLRWIMKVAVEVVVIGRVVIGAKRGHPVPARFTCDRIRVPAGHWVPVAYGR
jgi:hypothetical protein